MSMQIDQVGVSVGTPGVARPDLLSNGATVTLTDTAAGGSTLFQILYRPPADHASVESLAATGDSHVWTFHATSGVEGPWRVRLQHIAPGGAVTEEIRILGFSASGSGAIPPAPNEKASPDATELNKTDSAIILASERNWPTTDYPDGNPYGWSNSVATSGGGAVASVFGRTGVVVAAVNDYAASFITNDSSVTGATVKDALNALIATTTLQSAYNAGATIALTTNDLVFSKSSVELFRLGTAATLKAADRSTAGATGYTASLVGSAGGAAAVSGFPGDGGMVLITAGTLGSEALAHGSVIGTSSSADVIISGGSGGDTSGVKAGNVIIHGGHIGTGGSGGTNVPGDITLGTDANKTHTIRSGNSNGVSWEHQGPIWSPLVTIADATTITISADKSIRHKVVLGGNRTLDLAFPSSYSNSIVSPFGISGVLIVQQDGAGSRTLSFAAKFKTSGDVSLNSAASAYTIFQWTIETTTVVHIRKVEASTGSGTITAVVAGTGLTGGGSSGSVTLTVAYGTSGTTAAVGNDSRLSDDRAASGIRTASTLVTVSGATAPSSGQVLTATSSTAATWQTPASGVSLTTNAPANVTASAAAVGTGTAAARDDHKHNITTAAPSTLTVGGSNVAGSATSLALSDHTHGLPAFGATSGTFAQGNDSRLSDDRTASGLRSATTIVVVSAATAPTSGQVLQATSGTAAQWASLTTGPASQIATSGTPVSISSTPPTTGQVLQATSTTAAAWATLGAGSGDFVGPGSSVSGNIVSFNGTTGKLGQDSGVAAASVVLGPSSVVTARIATFNGTTGKLIQDSGSLITDFVPGTRTVTAGTGLSGGGALSSNITLTVASTPALQTTGTAVSVSAAVPPSTGQVLTATSATTATWQTPAVPTFSIATDINPLHWWRADTTSQSGGFVDTITDNGSGAKNFTQTGSARCATAVDGNSNTYLAPNGTSMYYQAGVAADWTFLNDGSPYTIALILHRTALVTAVEMLLDTADGTSGNIGCIVSYAYASSVSQGPSWSVGAASLGNQAQACIQRLPSTNLDVLVVRHSGNGTQINTSVDRSIDGSLRRKGRTVSESMLNPSRVYSTGAPAGPLTLFRRSVTSSSFTAARVYDVIVDSVCWSDRQVTGYEEYARNTFKVVL